MSPWRQPTESENKASQQIDKGLLDCWLSQLYLHFLPNFDKYCWWPFQWTFVLSEIMKADGEGGGSEFGHFSPLLIPIRWFTTPPPPIHFLASVPACFKQPLTLSLDGWHSFSDPERTFKKKKSSTMGSSPMILPKYMGWREFDWKGIQGGSPRLLYA